MRGHYSPTCAFLSHLLSPIRFDPDRPHNNCLFDDRKLGLTRFPSLFIYDGSLPDAEMGRRMRRNIDAEAELNLPPGFRFHPTDEELIVHYLCKKAAHQIFPAPIIAEVNLYKCDPWTLPEKALFGDDKWYFFTPRDRKYPNGSKPNRAAGSGYWKATGADKPVHFAGRSKPVGIKKALIFYTGKPSKGIKTNWIMHEYRLADTDRTVNKTSTLRLDD